MSFVNFWCVFAYKFQVTKLHNHRSLCLIAVKIVKIYNFVYFSAMVDHSVMVRILN